MKKSFTERLMPILEEEIHRLISLTAAAVSRFVCIAVAELLRGIESVFLGVREWIDSVGFDIDTDSEPAVKAA